MKTHWKKHFDPNYLGAYSLDQGETRTLVISRVASEEVTDPTGAKDTVFVVHFETGKPMIFNKTNASFTAKIIGSNYTEDWVGKEIGVTIKKVKAFGDLVEALRVVEPKNVTKPTISGPRYTDMVKAIKDGKFKKEDAFKRFNLTKEQKAEINEL